MYFKCESIRLCRFLYSLGFEKTSITQDGKEYWLFKRTNELQESLDFYFYMRKKTKEFTGDNSEKKDIRRSK